MDTPVDVKVIVYDLLPPSKLASLLNFVGTGVYHTSVQLTLPLGPKENSPIPSEYAFGGHDSPHITGVFSIPAGTAPQRMPGLRMYTTLDLGEAFGDSWRKEFGKSKPTRRLRKQSSKASLLRKTGRHTDDGETIAGPPYSGFLDHATSTMSFDSLPRSPDPAEDDDDEWDSDDGGRSDGTEYMSRSQRKAWRIVQELKRDPSWRGTEYRLLQRNCNTFTEELVYRLTGRRPPPWINRAAWVATSLPCIIPAGWIDDAEEAAPDADSSTSPSLNLHDPANLASDDSTIKIEPPRADKMDLGGRT